MAERQQRRIETSIVKTINLGNYESVKIGATISTVIADKADIDKAFGKLWDKCNDQVEEELASYDSEDTPDEVEAEQPLEDEVENTDSKIDEPDETEAAEGTEDGEDAEDDITEDEINAMSKKELVDFCNETEGLEDINTKKAVKVLRILVIDALFEDEDEDEEAGDDADTSGDDNTDTGDEDGDDEWGDDEWGDD